MEWQSLLTWFLMGFFGGLGFLCIQKLWSLIVK